jgi:hypothetical protein
VPIGSDQNICGEQICAPTAFCDFSDPTAPRCREAGGVGAACMGHAQCTTSYCPAGFCAELPGEGEPCTVDGDCRSGTLCGQSEADPQGTCFSVAPMCLQLVLVPWLLQGYDYEPYYY